MFPLANQNVSFKFRVTNKMLDLIENAGEPTAGIRHMDQFLYKLP